MGLLSVLGSLFMGALSILTALPLVDIVSVFNVAKALLEKLGVIESDVQEDGLGDKVLQARELGVTPENFDKFEDYYKEIKNFEVDPEKSNKFTSEDKKIAATLCLAELLQVKLGAVKDVFALEVMPKFNDNLAVERLKGYEVAFNDKFDDVNRYFKGTISEDKLFQVEKNILSVEQKLNADKSYAEIFGIVENVRAKVINPENRI